MVKGEITLENRERLVRSLCRSLEGHLWLECMSQKALLHERVKVERIISGQVEAKHGRRIRGC